MFGITPKDVTRHMTNGKSSGRYGDIARIREEVLTDYRRERRSRYSRFVASVYRSLPFVGDAIEPELVVPVEATQTT